MDLAEIAHGGSESRVCQFLDFSNQTIIKGVMANFVKREGFRNFSRASLVRNYSTLSVWAGEGQSGNPIGSELVSNNKSIKMKTTFFCLIITHTEQRYSVGFAGSDEISVIIFYSNTFIS